jgi:hypothetical protein
MELFRNSGTPVCIHNYVNLVTIKRVSVFNQITYKLVFAGR